MIYFDTAYLVKCYVKEPGWETVREIARQRRRIACSIYGRMELHAAFHRHVREGNLSGNQLQTVFTQLALDESRRLWTWLPITETIMNRVVDTFKLLPTDVFLRTADAVHLATARENGISEVYTNDDRMIRAAASFLVRAENPIGPG
ncbi:MAG: PIN domain-containing protein [Spirochaetaceae bacterium]|nr:MAG: PIN domain-containing protein [Spirochaetaceae bacterium]